MSYLHHVPGRIRVRATGVKHNAPRADALKQWLESLKGVERVDVNTLTGSVLIHYTVAATDGTRLITLMRRRKWISPWHAEAGLTPALGPSGIERAAARAILGYLAKAAIEHSLIAIAAAVL
jgi:hypothetical protein